MANKDKLRGKQQSGRVSAGPPPTVTGMMEDILSDAPSLTVVDDERLDELEAELQEKQAQIDEYKHTAIVPLADGKFGFRRFEFSAVGLKVPDDITKDEVKDFLLALKEADDAIAWTVGDLANAAERIWKQGYEDLEKMTGYKYQTLRDYAYVANAVPLSIRIDKLKFSHHRVIASMTEIADKVYWLEQCAVNEWSVAEFKQQIEDAQRKPPRLRVIIDELHRDMLPKLTKAESALKRALKTKLQEDVKKARDELYQTRQAAIDYFEALEDELNKI